MQQGSSRRDVSSENKKDASSQTHAKPTIRAVGVCCQQTMHTIVEEDQGLVADERLATDRPDISTRENQNDADNELPSTIISDGNSTRAPSHPNHQVVETSPSRRPRGIYEIVRTSPTVPPNEFIKSHTVTNDEENITVAPAAAAASCVPTSPSLGGVIDLCHSRSDTYNPPAIDIESLRKTCTDLCSSRDNQTKIDTPISYSVQTNKSHHSKNCAATSGKPLLNCELLTNASRKHSTNLGDYSEVIFYEAITGDSRQTAILGSTEFMNGVRSRGTSKLKPPRLVKCTEAALTLLAPQGKSIACREAAGATILPLPTCPWKIVLNQKRHSLPNVKSVADSATEIQARRTVASKQFCNASSNIDDDKVTGPQPMPMIIRDSDEEQIMQSPEISSSSYSSSSTRAGAGAGTVVCDCKNHKFDPSSLNPSKLESLLSEEFSDTSHHTHPSDTTRTLPPPPTSPSPRNLTVKTPQHGGCSSGNSGSVFYNASVVPVNRCSLDQKQLQTKRIKSPRTISPHSVSLSAVGSCCSDAIDISHCASSAIDYKTLQSSNELSKIDSVDCPPKTKTCSSHTSNIPQPYGSACMTSSTADCGLSISSSSTGSSIVSMVSSIESGESDNGAYGHKRRWTAFEKNDKAAIPAVRGSLTVERQKSATLQPTSQCKNKLTKGKSLGARNGVRPPQVGSMLGTNVQQSTRDGLVSQKGKLFDERSIRSTRSLHTDAETSSTENLK